MKTYREKAVRRIRYYRAIGIISAHFKSDEIIKINEVIKNPRDFTREDIKRIDEEAKGYIESISEKVNLDANLEEIESIAPIKEDKFVDTYWIEKGELEKVMDADNLLRGDTEVPSHSRFGISPLGSTEREEIWKYFS